MLVGIDLGTTNSLVAHYANGKPELIPNRLGSFLTPSVVAIDQDGQVLVGETAREYGYLHPLDVASTFKRSMGTEKEFQLDTRTFRAEELSSFVLRSLKEDAEVFLGCPVEDAIISVPAYFNDLQRKATKKAGELAGLNVVRIINEPTAAALAYGVGTEDKDERCLVFDLGGGTFDVSILEFFGTMMEVHAIAGDNFLGGEDFTQILARLFLSMAGLTPQDINPRELAEVNKAAEQAKRAFSKNVFVEMSATINGSPLWKVIAIEEYEKACQPLLERLRKPIERSLRDADLHVVDIDRIVMVGGGTRLKMVRDYIGKLFLSFPEEGVDPDTAIAQGAALQCGMKERDAEIREVVLTDVCPFTLGTEVVMGNGSFEEGGHFLPIIERNTVIPVSRTQRVFTAHDNQEKVRVTVLQGESRLAKNNILLGELEMSVPRGPAGKEAVEVTYTYDVNALLEVMVHIVSTDETRAIYIQNENTQLTDAEIAERMEKLAHLKQNPREEEQNKLALLRGERMYEECTGDDRLLIGQAMANFDRALNAHDVTASNEQRKLLIKLLDQIEFGE